MEKNNSVSFLNSRGNHIEIVIKQTGFSCLKTSFASMTTAYIHHGSVKPLYRMSFFFRSFDKSRCHCEAVSFFAGAACDYNNFFAHKIYPPYDSGIDFSLFRYYHNSKNEMKIKYAQLSAILKFV